MCLSLVIFLSFTRFKKQLNSFQTIKTPKFLLLFEIYIQFDWLSNISFVQVL